MAAVPAPAPLPPAPAHTPAGAFVADHFRVNRMRRRRGQGQQTPAVINGYYRRNTLAHPPPNFNPANVPQPYQVPLQAANPPLPLQQSPAPTPLTASQRAFLRRYPKGLTAGDMNTSYKQWRGVKFLGQGAFGRVGLWSYTGPKAFIPQQQTPAYGLPALPPTLSPISQYVVVKESVSQQVITPNGATVRRIPSLEKEFEAMFARSVSDHSVTCWRGSPRGVGDKPMLRIFMEYLPLGDIWSLLNRRAQRRHPFSERTLWAMFNCLVDGAAVITDRQEMVPAGATYNRNIHTNAQGVAVDGVHFDLKIDNVLLGGLNATHDEPVLKISDYGLFREFRANVQFPNQFPGELDEREDARDLSSFLNRAPEQWTERWDYAEAIRGPSEPIAGQYGAKTNIWGIALVMFVAITLGSVGPLQQRNDPASPGPDNRLMDPYIPIFVNARQAFLSHGYELQVLPGYSAELRELLQECLYEDPTNRPTLEELKRRVMAGWNRSLTTPAGDPVLPEPFDDFLAYEDPELVDRRAGRPAPNPPPRVTPLTPQQIVLISGGRPTLPNPILNGQIVRCQAPRNARRPKGPLCSALYITDGIIDNCGAH